MFGTWTFTVVKLKKHRSNGAFPADDKQRNVEGKKKETKKKEKFKTKNNTRAEQSW